MTSRFESILNSIRNSYEIGDTSVEIERDFIHGHYSYHFESPIFTATISSHCDGITCGYYRIEINFNRSRNNHESTSCWFTSDYARMVRSFLAEIC